MALRHLKHVLIHDVSIKTVNFVIESSFKCCPCVLPNMQKSSACAVCCNRIREGLYLRVTGWRANLSVSGLTASLLSSAPPNYAVKVSVYALNMPGNFTASRNKLSMPSSVLQMCCVSLEHFRLSFSFSWPQNSVYLGTAALLCTSLLWFLVI